MFLGVISSIVRSFNDCVEDYVLRVLPFNQPQKATLGEHSRPDRAEDYVWRVLLPDPTSKGDLGGALSFRPS